jgi:hypothetical protein
MRFGRVEGIVLPLGDGADAPLRLIVHLESGRGFEVVRDETLAPLRPIAGAADLRWHADQWTQETIGVDLALQGWEPIGEGDEPPAAPGAAARSRAYAVRRL